MVELAITAKFTGRDLWQTVSIKTLRQCIDETLAIGRSIFSLLLEFHNPVADEPVPQGQRDIDGFGGKILRLMMDMDDGSYQRVKVSRSGEGC